MLHQLLRHSGLTWLLKANCLLCERPVDQNLSAALCHRCRQQLHACQRPDQRVANQVSWGHYQGSLRRLLHQLKYQNQPTIADIFGQLLAQTWQQHQLPRCAVIPIPLHPNKQTQRGYNQAELIARRFCQLTGMQCYNHILQRQHATEAQHQLSRSQRHANLKSAFRLGDRRHLPRPILFIDDIYTTGATIQAATDCFDQIQQPIWGSLVVAR